jgi:hypothetical protein
MGAHRRQQWREGQAAEPYRQPAAESPTQGHVAISLENGYILEARGHAYGVMIGPVRPSFNLATKVQELYTPAALG